MIGLSSVTRPKPKEVEQEVVDGMGGGHGVQRYDTGVGFLNAVGLFLTFDVGFRLNRQLRWIDLGHYTRGSLYPA